LGAVLGVVLDAEGAVLGASSSDPSASSAAADGVLHPAACALLHAEAIAWCRRASEELNSACVLTSVVMEASVGGG
jgi:hypothetical protein